MKKIFSVSVCSILMLCGFSQKTPSSSRAAAVKAAESEEMMRQSNRSRTAAIVMVSGGSTMVMGGMIMMIAGASNGYYNNNVYSNNNEDLMIAGAVTSVVGLGLALGSIPVFIKSHRLRKEAKLSFSPLNLKMPMPGNNVARIPQAQVSFKMPIGR